MSQTEQVYAIKLLNLKHNQKNQKVPNTLLVFILIALQVIFFFVIYNEKILIIKIAPPLLMGESLMYCRIQSGVSPCLFKI